MGRIQSEGAFPSLKRKARGSELGGEREVEGKRAEDGIMLILILFLIVMC